MTLLSKIATFLRLAENVGEPKAFVAGNYYPQVIKAWSNKYQVMEKLIAFVNRALYKHSAGKVDFQHLKSINYNLSPSDVADINAQELIKLSLLIYNNLLTNNSTPFSDVLSAEARKEKIDILKSFLSTSTIRSGTSFPELGDVKNVISSLLIELAS